MKKTAFILFLSFLGLQVFAQKNFLEATVTFTNGETVKGMVDYRNWARHPKDIHFGKNENLIKEYTAKDISRLTVNNDTYISSIVSSRIESNMTDGLTYKKEIQLQSDTTFLLALVEGKKSLYYFRNDFATDNYYIKTEKGIELLEYHRYLQQVNQHDKLRENKKYMLQLKNYLSDWSGVSNRLKEVEYKSEDLKNLFLDYYEATSKEPDFVQRKEKVKAKFGIVAGGGVSKIKFNASSGFVHLRNGEFPVVPTYVFGASVRLIFPRHLERLQVQNEIVYTTSTYEGNYYDDQGNGRYVNYDTTIGVGAVKINNMFRYRLGVKEKGVFFGAGISNGFLFETKNELNKESFLLAEPINTTEKALSEFSKHELGLLAGIGYQIKGFSLECRYEHGLGMSPFTGLASPVEKIYLQLGYSF